MQSTLVVNWPTRSFGLRGFPPGSANHEQISFLENYRFLLCRSLIDFFFANYRFYFENNWQVSGSWCRKLQILFRKSLTDFCFANFTDLYFPNYRFSFRFLSFRFANHSKPKLKVQKEDRFDLAAETLISYLNLFLCDNVTSFSLNSASFMTCHFYELVENCLHELLPFARK